jgi:hypothetical protein
MMMSVTAKIFAMTRRLEPEISDSAIKEAAAAFYDGLLINSYGPHFALKVKSAVAGFPAATVTFWVWVP